MINYIKNKKYFNYDSEISDLYPKYAMIYHKPLFNKHGLNELNVESSKYADWVETVKCTYSSIEDKKFLHKWIQHTIKEIKTCDDVFGYTICAMVTVTITKLIENGITFMSIIEYAIAFFIGLIFLLFAVGVLRKKRNFYEELLDVILELEKD